MDINESLKQTLENQIAQYQVRRAVCSWQITDAQTLTGNPEADKALRQDALVATNTMVMLDRQIATRVQELDKLLATQSETPQSTAPIIAHPGPAIIN